MEKEFINYEEALALKELGFNKPCLGYYTGDTMHFVLRSLILRINELESYVVTAPLYQQTFRWFREKYNLDGSITIDVWNTKKAYWRITGGIENIIFVNNSNELYDWESGYFNTYEETELDCLKKLIEIVKNDNKAN